MVRAFFWMPLDVREGQHGHASEGKPPGNCNNNFQFRGIYLIKFRVMEDMMTEASGLDACDREYCQTEGFGPAGD